MTDNQQQIEKYKELFYLSKEVFNEEMNRSARMDEKASKYLAVLTFLLGIFGFFSEKIYKSIIPPHHCLEWILLSTFAILIIVLVSAWLYTFRVLQIRNFEKIPIDIDFFANQRLITVYDGMTRTIKSSVEYNREKGNEKSKFLSNGYKLMISTVFLLIIISVLFVTNVWRNSNNINNERRLIMSDDGNNSTQGQDQEQAVEQPDTTVTRPKPDLVTEGFDPSKIRDKKGSSDSTE